MDRPEHPEQPSIFSRPDRELEDDWTRPAEHADDHDPEPAEPSAWAGGPIRPARDPLYPGRPARPTRTGPSREVLLVAGGGGLIALLLAGFIVANLIGGEPTTAAASPTPSSSADPVDSASPSPSASASPSPSAVPTPPPAPEPLVAGEWATIITDAVSVHASASLSAAVSGTANRGEIVLVDEEPKVEADGFTWYHAIVAPGLAGWIAAHDETDQFALSDAPTTSVRWCAVPDGAAFEVSAPTHMAPGETTLLGTAHLGGLPVATELLGSAGSGIVELAWGTQDQVCLDLAITNGRVNAVGISSSIEGCGYVANWAPMMIQFGTGAVDAGGQADSRRAVLDPTIIGFDPATAGQRPNLADVFSLASQRGADAESLCVTASASGAATSPSLAFDAGTIVCAWVSSRTSSIVTLSYPNSDGAWVELRLTAGSFVGEGVTAQSHSFGAEKGFRVSAERGVDGSLGISVRALEGCGS